MPAPTEGQHVRRQTQDARCESRERLDRLFADAQAGIALADRNGRFRRGSPPYCRLLGYTEEELCQLDYASLLHPDDREVILKELGCLESGQTHVIRLSGRYLHKNGQFIHLRKYISMVSGRDGDKAHLITVADCPSGGGQSSQHDRELLARLYETIPVLLVLWDPRLQIFTLNAHTERVLGWTTADANECDFMSNVYPDPEYRAKVCAYMQALEPGWREWLGTARNGERIPIEWANIRLSDNTMIGIGVDVRQRKAAEAALQASEARFQSIVETNVIGVLFADMQSGQVLDANDEYLRIVGRTRQELREGKINWKAITPPEELKREEMLVCCCQAGERMVPFDKNYIRPDGTRVPVFIGGSVLPHDRGKAVAFVLDIGERKEAEEALRESEHRYRTLFNSIDEGFCIIEMEFDENLRAADYRFLETNPSFRRQTGLCDLVGNTMRSLAPDHEDYWFDIYGSVALTGKPVRFQRFAKQLDRWYDVYAFQFGNAEKRQVAVLFNDITGQRRAAEQLRQMNELLEQHVAERTEEVRQQAAQLRALASQLSQAEQRERKRLAKILHDHIQQLIVAARMQMAWMKCDGDSERQAIVQGVDSILDEALDASRSLAMDLSPPVLHEAGLIGGLNWLATRMWVKHQFAVNLQADNKAEPATEEVRFLLFECVRELLFNAIKHAGVTEAEVTLWRTEDGNLELTVCDRGEGMRSSSTSGGPMRSPSACSVFVNAWPISEVQWLSRRGPGRVR